MYLELLDSVSDILAQAVRLTIIHRSEDYWDETSNETSTNNLHINALVHGGMNSLQSATIYAYVT